MMSLTATELAWRDRLLESASRVARLACGCGILVMLVCGDAFPEALASSEEQEREQEQEQGIGEVGAATEEESADDERDEDQEEAEEPAYSDLLKGDNGEWQREILRFEIEDGVDVVGASKIVEVGEEETLLDIAMRYAVGYEEIRLANPDIDIWLPGEGTEVVIPNHFLLPDVERKGIVINLAEMRLYYFPPGEDVVETFPVSIGRLDWSTPLGETEITELIEDPVWYPPRSIREQAAEQGEDMPRLVPPGPDNPLGEHAILLDIPGYLLHGTNRPWGIGMRATHGCIRLHPFDIDHLFGQIERGTRVKIINQPFKAGWSANGQLYMQAFPLIEEEQQQLDRQDKIAMAADAVARALGERRHRVRGELVRAVAAEQNGNLIKISRSGGDSPLNLEELTNHSRVQFAREKPAR
ncbi:L,D-transpeptidase family protein [Halorhodospira halochloris]|uniref:L,D-transpeptidase family protein n=1 Tax=Halorhodospira halochloris TaxID=1052 RepID=UPI001EE7ACF9|nr:L,D-transpeptidase family protein [Halorhodospira halochloris]MCG5530480.1 L,D-transpeptidase family protein [Halorhodospira halochloris]